MLFRQAGDRVREAGTLTNLGVIRFTQGRYQEASILNAQALDIYRQASDLSGEMKCLSDLGNTEERQGRYQQAAACLGQALALYQEIGDRSGEAGPLNTLGEALLVAGPPTGDRPSPATPTSARPRRTRFAPSSPIRETTATPSARSWRRRCGTGWRQAGSGACWCSTTRDLGAGVSLDVFTEPEGAGLLAERAGSANPEGARLVAAELGYLPLALAQAGRCARRTRQNGG